MGKVYIDKSSLVAEMGRLRKIQPTDEFQPKEQNKIDWLAGKLFTINSLEVFLDTFEVKEVENFIWNNARTTVPEDSTNQIICIKEDGLAVSTIGKIVNGTVKWAYLDDLLKGNKNNKYCKNRL